MTESARTSKQAKTTRTKAPKAPKAQAIQDAAPKAPKAAVMVPCKPVRPVLPELQFEDLTAFGMPPELAAPLFQAVTTMRGGDSLAEANFAAWLLKHCMAYASLRMVDAAGNMHFTIPTPQGKDARTIFVAHTDTVHHTGGKNKVGFDGAMIHGVDEPLGADDGAGIAILCYLMSKGVPGRYIFTRQEETGGVGAKHIGDTMGGVLKKHDRAIAFDRRGTGEVIITQGGSECASSEFGDALSDALNEHGLLYMASSKGMYTDTKEFRHAVPECVNVATGYYQEHGEYEHLDLAHFTMLALAAARIDWEMLPTVRVPQEDPKIDWTFGSWGADAYKPKTPSTSAQKLSATRLSIIEDAIFDWYWGRKAALTDLLIDRLATREGVSRDEAKSQVFIGNLRESIADTLDYEKSDNEILDRLLKHVTNV